MPKGNQKGSAFERDICKALSLWWSDGKRSDIFWRTSGSGARAKTRSKKGETTFGQYGDVQATDPIGQPLIDLCTIELKRGYSNSSLMDLIDKPKSAADQQYEKFIKQARQDSANAKTPYWILIVKRNRRETILIMPFRFCSRLKRNPIRTHILNASHSVKMRAPKQRIYATTLINFLRFVKPKHIKELLVLTK